MEESRFEDYVAITWVTYRVRKNRLKDNTGSSSRLGGPVQMNAMTDRYEVVANDPRRHHGMTLRRRRSQHPRVSSPLDRRRRRMPIYTTPSEDFISPRHISPGLRARGVIYSIFPFNMNFFSPHVFKRAFAYFLLSLLGLRVGSPLFGIPLVKPFPFVNLYFL